MDDFPVMTRDEIRRRLSRMVGEKDLKRMHQVTLRDVARWMGVSRGCTRGHLTGAFEINEAHQISYSAFFALIDAGCLKLEVRGGRKALVRVKPPKDPPRRALLPHIDFSIPIPKLRFD